MRTLETHDLRRMLNDDDDFTLVNVLAPEQFRDRHIADSINIPVALPDFVQEVEEATGGKQEPVVVYCASASCNASRKAAAQLEAAGFSHVMAYEGGVAAWSDAGLPLIGALASESTPP